MGLLSTPINLHKPDKHLIKVMKVNILTVLLAMTSMMACQNTDDKKTASSADGAPTQVQTPVTAVPAPQTQVEPSNSSAAVDPEKRNPAFVGRWQGVEWSFMGKPSGLDASQVFWTFRADGTFKSNYADQHKQGTWRTTKDSLYTKDIKMPKEVPSKILLLNDKLLDLQYNVKGQKEIIKYKKLKD